MLGMFCEMSVLSVLSSLSVIYFLFFIGKVKVRHLQRREVRKLSRVLEPDVRPRPRPLAQLYLTSEIQPRFPLSLEVTHPGAKLQVLLLVSFELREHCLDHLPEVVISGLQLLNDDLIVFWHLCPRQFWAATGIW